MTQSVEDGSTVKIFYESRLAKVYLDDKILREIDNYYASLEEDGAPDELIEESKRRFSRLEVIVGDKDRLELVAKDIYTHYNERKNFLNGKAMIVCMSRKIAFDLYNILIDIAPELKTQTAVIVTESNKDNEVMRDMFKDSEYRKRQAEEFKKKNASLKIAIVVDMWLTGFDVADLDVMYIDKPMKGHNLMQAIARVNRVNAGKESGLIVDYIGIKNALNSALNEYTARDKELNLQPIQDSAKAICDEKISILDEMLHGVEKAGFLGKDENKRFKAIQNGADFVLTSNDIKKKYLKLTKQLKDAYVVAIGILDNDYKKKILYYITVRYFIQKIEYEGGGYKFNPADINRKIIDLIGEAIKGDEVKVLTQIKDTEQNRSVWDLLDEKKIEELRKTNPPHIFIKIMERLLKEAVAEYRGYNLVKAKEYSERLRKILEIYNTRADDTKTDMTIVGLIGFSKEMVENETKARKNHLSGRERAFYDALATNKNAFQLMGDDLLRVIAIELKEIVEEYSTVDWSKKKNTQAKMRLHIKRVLKKYKYPPDYTEEAITRVIDQAEYMM
jgi:type I restriction enzyme R subunit